MNINVLTTPGVLQVAQQVGVHLSATQANTLSGHVRNLIARNPGLARDPGLQRSLLQLGLLKAKLRRRQCRHKRRTHRRRTKSLHHRTRQLLSQLKTRLRDPMLTFQPMQQAATQRWGNATGQDYSFLSDPRLSTAEKLQRLLIELSAKYDDKAEELMKKLGNSSKKSQGSPMPEFMKKVVTTVAGTVAGPMGAMAANLLSGASGGDDKKNEKVLEFELQRIMQRANQLFSMASQLQKNEHDTSKGIIGRMAV